VRHLGPTDLGGPFPLVVADLSFISLRTVAPALVGLSNPGGDLVVLVKPQFEVGRREVSRGRGVIRDPASWRDAIVGVESAMQSQGAVMMGLVASPIRGADGNVEFLAHLRSGSPDPDPNRVGELIDAALSELAADGPVR